MLPAYDVRGFEFAALDALQHGLTRDAERTHGLSHGQEAVACFAVETSPELIGQANAPGRAGRELLAGDDPIVEQTMDRRGGDAESGGRLFDGQEVAVGSRLFSTARDVPMPAQIADAGAIEAMTVCGAPTLFVENAGDHGVGIMRRQSAQQRNRVLVGANSLDAIAAG